LKKILADEYQINTRLREYSYSLVTGFTDRFADFFDYYSNMQECKRSTLILERRFARFTENYVGKYVYGDNTKYDESELSMIFLSEVIRMVHPVVFHCQYGIKYDFYYNGVLPLAEKSILYNI
jgi:hypothetical protein